MNEHTLGDDYRQQLKKDRAKSLKMLKSFIRVAERILELGGHVSFEWPKSCRRWIIPELLEFITKHDLYSCVVDGCYLGMTNDKDEPILKRWRFVTSCYRTFQTLSEYKC